ncbi:cell division protein ZapA [Pseudooceanicola sp.]|uniref:cell division protein ZapA n=1 Tax=Pseudooceanicola sp. TaxID=1914328 RepID=UPI0026025AB8|nr:cell division protein ZapA [Pseudooceanicola sp.]MDF1855465.1 cell division protein ZapA [Pseudooceanicola sp.]
MPEIEITIGGRQFEVACAEGEEHYLLSAAKMLDTEATALADQIGRVPEGRMLLMAGLMLADRTAGLEDKQRESQRDLEALRAEIETLKSAPAPAPQRIEVPVVPTRVTDTLAELAARAESLAASLEEKAQPG